MNRVRIVGIAGPSCAGKSLFAASLAARIPGSVLVGLDRYYRDCSHLPPDERSRQNFDHPNAFEWSRLERDVDALAMGHEVQLPAYDFSRHVRCTEFERCGPARLVIVEGILALASPTLRARYDLAIFIDASRDTCRNRRVDRDVAFRGRTAESVVRQIAETVEPMYDTFVAPTRAYADVILDGTRPAAELVNEVAALLDVTTQ